MKEIIAVGKDIHEIDVKSITLICKSENLTEDVTYAERVPLDMQACLYHMDRTQAIHADVEKYIRMVFPQHHGEITPDSIRREGTGFRHFAGRIDMTLKLMQIGVQVAWVYPEDGLHPGAQCKLGDVVILLTS